MLITSDGELKYLSSTFPIINRLLPFLYKSVDLSDASRLLLHHRCRGIDVQRQSNNYMRPLIISAGNWTIALDKVQRDARRDSYAWNSSEESSSAACTCPRSLHVRLKQTTTANGGGRERRKGDGHGSIPTARFSAEWAMIVTFHAVRVVAAKRHIRRRRRGARAACRSRHSAIGKTDDRVDRQMENAAVGRLAWVVSSSRLSPSERPSRCVTRAEILSRSYERERGRERRSASARSYVSHIIELYKVHRNLFARAFERYTHDVRVFISCQSPPFNLFDLIRYVSVNKLF